ncbi:unnamed protein product [Rotaria sp. Silwood2]|nr:unnamed protein product [Rotaria sp. Silwood2]CAF4447509.1 unnamed protein product [Rotaria sp. Silwood2]
MSSLSTRFSKQKHIINNDLSDIIEETKRCLNVNNTQHIDSNYNNLLNLSNKFEIQSSSLSSISESNSVLEITHQCRNKKKSRIGNLNKKSNISINKCKKNSNLNLNNNNNKNSFEKKMNISNVISWWEDNQQEILNNKNEHDNMLITSDETLQNIVNGALNLMLTNSKSRLEKQIKTFVDRKKLKRNRQHIQSNV